MDNLQSEFVNVRQGAYRGMVHRDWAQKAEDPVAFTKTLEADAGKMLRGGEGQGITTRLSLFDREVFRKIYVPGRFHRRLRDLFVEYRSIREWKANCRCADAGIHTAKVLAAWSVGSALNARHYFISAPAEGDNFGDLLRDRSGEREQLLTDLGTYIRSLHDKGFFHAHLHTPHIFLTPEGRYTLIDLESSSITPTISDKHRARNLRQIRKSLGRSVSQAEVALFDKAYSSG